MGKWDLRKAVGEAYGEKFIREIYDPMGMGIPVGNLEDTIVYLNMISAVKEDLAARRAQKKEETTVRIIFGTLMAFGILIVVLLILTIAKGQQL